MAKFYGMKNDYMFKAVLQKAESVLRNLIAVLLDIDETSIKKCTILNSIELGKSVDAKDCVLDVLLELNSNETIDLEVQVRDEHNWPERSLLYWAKTYDSLKKGEDYNLLKKTYHIGILNFTLFKDNPSFYAEYEIRDTKTGYPYTDKLNIRVLDLTGIDKAIEEESANPKLIKWAKIFQAKTMKELESLAGDEEVFRTMVTHIKELTEDERIRQQCAAREDYERRMIGEYNRGTRDGLQKGEAIGIQKGILDATRSILLRRISSLGDASDILSIIDNQVDPGILNRWLDIAMEVSSIKDFKERISTNN